MFPVFALTQPFIQEETAEKKQLSADGLKKEDTHLAFARPLAVPFHWCFLLSASSTPSAVP